MSTTPPHPAASPDRPGAVTVSRIVARNSHHPEPYTGTRTVLVCSSKPRGRAAAAGGGTPPRTPPLRWRGSQGTRNDPDSFGSAAGGFTQAPGGWAGSKLERVEFPAFRLEAGWRLEPKLKRRKQITPAGSVSKPCLRQSDVRACAGASGRPGQRGPDTRTVDVAPHGRLEAVGKKW